MTAEFSLFPQSDNSDAPSVVSDTAKVTFIDPCLNPFTFTSETQINPDSDKFTGDDIVFNLSQFTITPTICELTYVCTSVV